MSFFLNGCFQWFKFCPTILETVGLRMPNRNFRDLVCLMLTLNVDSPSARCASMVNAIGSDIWSRLMIG